MPSRITQPGKFEGEFVIAPDVYGMEPDEDAGDVETTGFYALYRLDRGEIQALSKKYPQEDIGDIVGAIALEDSQGFVSFDWYTDKRTLEDAWDRVQKEVAI